MHGFIRKFAYAVATVVLSMTAWSDAAATVGIELIPANPGYMETVYLRLKPVGFPWDGTFFRHARASMSGNLIVVDYLSDFDIPTGQTYDVEIGRFPAGTYTVRAQRYQRPDEPVVTVQFTVPGLPEPFAPSARPIINYTDLWWNPAESGWGLSVTQGPKGVLVAVWFTFDSEGKPVWYVLQPGKWDFELQYSGPIYKTSGPYYGGAFDPNAVGVTQVGTGQLFFRNYDRGSFTYTVEGVSATKTIVRSGID